MVILVTGANGQLGTELRNVSEGSVNKYLFTDINSLPGVDTVHLDITDLDAVRRLCRSESVDAIVNCAAYTNVDAAEDDPLTAELLNSTAVRNLATVASGRGAKLVHISTDYVFQGDRPEPCREDWPTEPLGVYGATKLAGEKAVLESGCEYLIFRTAWLYSPYGKNFVKTIKRLTSEKDRIQVVYDQVGTPTYALDLAKLIYKVTEENFFSREGVYHYSDEGAVSWYDFAVAVRDLCGNSCDIRPCRTEEYPSKARRPRFSVLDKAKVKEAFGIDIPYWRDSLEDCLKRL